MDQCITCGNRINRNKAHIQVEYCGDRFLVCCPLCQSEFEKDPKTFIQKRKRKAGGHT